MLVGERTAALVGGAFELGEPRTIEAKGKAGGVVCRELRRMRAPRRPRGGHGLAARFVGRKRELEWLDDLVARTQADGRPRLATVVGEAGMGKTSLVRELRERLPAGTAFRLGRCLSYGRGVTYSALADVLRQELGLRQEDSAEAVLERLAGREILGLTLGLDVAGDLDPRAALLQLQDQWVQLISRARRGRTGRRRHRGSALGGGAAGRGARARALEGGGPGPRARHDAAGSARASRRRTC